MYIYIWDKLTQGLPRVFDDVLSGMILQRVHVVAPIPLLIHGAGIFGILDVMIINGINGLPRGY